MNTAVFRKFKDAIKKYGLFKEGDKILVAFSGGPDSTALLDLLVRTREELNLELAIAHFNHKLRLSADEDEQFVRRIAREKGLSIFVGSRDVRSYARKNCINLEEAGRTLRYEFLKQTAKKIGAAKIATGHTMTDQAETFLMRLLRGSGPRGLGGVFPAVEGRVIRPIILIERAGIELYLKERKLPYRLDESNFDRRYLRNRVRHGLIPYLQRHFEPQVVRQLSRAASILRDEDEILEKLTESESRKAILEKSGRLSLDMKALASFHPALARRILRHFIRELKGNLRGISFQDIESVRLLGEGKEIPVKKGLVLRREQGFLSLKQKTPVKTFYSCTWDGNKTFKLTEIGLRFRGKRMKRGDRLLLRYDDNTRAYFDASKLQFPLIVRNRHEGDRYQPLGSPGRKKLKEIMRAKKIPPSERNQQPVFLSAGQIAWVFGLPVSEKFKVDEATEIIFVIEKL